MDEIVEAALRKWPHVPACYGWLALDGRGQWWMRDDATQAAGPFPQVKGSLIRHEKLLGFIERNYSVDAAGAWFFQNGPQRVYVTLEAAPWVLGVQQQPSHTLIHTHTGLTVAHVHQAIQDEQGRFYLHTEHGLGLVRSMDMHAALDAWETLAWPFTTLHSAELPQRFGFVRVAA